MGYQIKRKVVVVLFALSLAGILWFCGIILIDAEFDSSRISYWEPWFLFSGGFALTGGVVGCSFTLWWLHKDNREKKRKRDILYLAVHPQLITPD